MILDGIDYGVPTKEGFFWWRIKECESWEVVRTWRDYDGKLTLFRATDACSNFDIEFGQWGPEVTQFSPMTQAEKDAEPDSDDDRLAVEIRSAVFDFCGEGLSLDHATRIIAIVREHDAKHIPNAGKVIEPDLYWKYEGSTDFYHVMLNGKSVFATKEARARDMFMAELSHKISKPTGGLNG